MRFQPTATPNGRPPTTCRLCAPVAQRSAVLLNFLNCCPGAVTGRLWGLSATFVPCLECVGILVMPFAYRRPLGYLHMCTVEVASHYSESTH
jgi:hypothetical protein